MEPISLMDLGLSDRSCEYHNYYRVEPKPPVFRNIKVTASASELEEIGIHPQIIRNILGKTVNARIQKIGGHKCATVPGATLLPQMFTVRYY